MIKPLVGVIMGSASDRTVMHAAKEMLRIFEIPYEEKILSAHRTPELTADYAKEVEERGLEAIIVGAGKAAHLAGVIASHTSLPVIGIPLRTGDLGGLDSLLSTVQMPSGVPVATVTIDGAKNAAILAAQILGLKHPEILKRVKEFKGNLAKAGGTRERTKVTREISTDEPFVDG